MNEREKIIRRKADGRQGFQGLRRASGACGVG